MNSVLAMNAIQVRFISLFKLKEKIVYILDFKI